MSVTEFVLKIFLAILKGFGIGFVLALVIVWVAKAIAWSVRKVMSK